MTPINQELRRSARVVLDAKHPSRNCILYPNAVGENTTKATIINLSRDGYCIETNCKLKNGQVVRIEFIDDVTHQQIVTFTQVVSARNLNISSNVSHWIGRPFGQSKYRYGCHNCVQLEVSKSFIEFYDRALSDSHMNKLNKPVKERLSLRSLFTKKKPVIYRLCTTASEREAAYRLVYSEYLARNFTTANPHGMFTSVYQLLPKSLTFIGKRNHEAVMTITAVSDSDFGLSMDKLYKDVLDPLRKEGRKLVELTMLSTSKSLFEKGAFSLNHYKKMSALFGMFRHAVRFVMHAYGTTDIVISVNPKYQKLYGYLCFEPIGELKYYAEFNNQPAIALRLDLKKATDSTSVIELKRKCLVRYFFGKKFRNFYKIEQRTNERRHAFRVVMDKFLPTERMISDRRQKPVQLTTEDLNYLYVQKSDLAERLDVIDLLFLGKYFPELKSWIDLVLAARNLKSTQHKISS